MKLVQKISKEDDPFLGPGRFEIDPDNWVLEMENGNQYDLRQLIIWFLSHQIPDHVRERMKVD